MSTNKPRPGLPHYDAAHNKAARAAKAAMPDGQPCCRCRRPMWRSQLARIDLDHATTNTYRGLAHATCNRRAGAIKGNKMRGQRRRQARQTPPPTAASRNW